MNIAAEKPEYGQEYRLIDLSYAPLIALDEFGKSKLVFQDNQHTRVGERTAEIVPKEIHVCNTKFDLGIVLDKDEAESITRKRMNSDNVRNC